MSEEIVNKQEKICCADSNSKKGRRYGNEKAEFAGSAGRDLGYPPGAERIVPAVRSTVHYTDSGYLWGSIIHKGGNVREKQGTVVEEVHKVGK